MRKFLLISLLVVSIALAFAYTGTRNLKWNSPIDVYISGHVSSEWKIEEAVSEWTDLDSGLVIRMTKNPDLAEIMVYEGELDCTNAGQNCINGMAFVPFQYGSITVGRCFLILNPRVSEVQMREHTAIHELGHCFGMRHSTYNSNQTIMNPGVSIGNTLDRPGTADAIVLRYIYGER